MAICRTSLSSGGETRPLMTHLRTQPCFSCHGFLRFTALQTTLDASS
jgi:hypothetical protein